MKISREIKTAILVISSILLFIWGYSFLKGTDLFTDYKIVYVTYDNVEGLANSAPVTFNGLIIGKVKRISFDASKRLNIVELQLNGDYPISKTSRATQYEPGLIGGKQIMIIPNYDDASMIETGNYLNGDVQSSMSNKVMDKLAPLTDKVDLVLLSANKLINNLNEVLDEKGKTDLKKTLSSLNETMNQLSQASKSANEMLLDYKPKLSKSTENLEKITTDFAIVSDSLAKANIGKTVKDLEKTLASANKIMADIQSGKGTMGKLIKDDAMYNNFTKASKELELLLQDLRIHPTRYINVSLFGKKEKPYVAPPSEGTINTN